MIRVGTRWQVIEGGNQLHIAHPAQYDFPFAVLHGLRGVGDRQGSFGFQDRAKMPCDQIQGGALVEPACDRHHGVVGLVVRLVEGAQALYRYVFNVRSGAYGGSSIVVPLIGGRRDSLIQYP